MRKDTPIFIKSISKNLRKNQTQAEQILWKEIRNNKLHGYKFRRQYAIGRYIADFYCSSAGLVIQIDGKIHDVYEQKEYDLIREKEIKSRKINILRFSNGDVLNNINNVLFKIHAVLQKLAKELPVLPSPDVGEGS